jgi:2-keto-4-pentenoate hydratase/2-oxohepta-3-ene-1,7-dioic acid hydratase in catechol pathway
LHCRDFATQLGPVLVTIDALAAAPSLRAQIRVAGVIVAEGALADPLDALAEAVACASQLVDLHPGDVVTLATPLAAIDPVAHGAPVELLIERLGKLVGTAARAPALASWKR